MSKEYEFHKLIEQQNEEEKHAFLNKMCSHYEIIDNNIVSDNEVLILERNSKRKGIVLFSVVFACLVALFFGLYFGLKKKSFDDFRYCDKSEYYILDTDITIKQYANEHSIKLLYFDIYEESEYYSDKQYRLIDTDEVICLYEEILDETNAFITFFVTDNKTEVDLLKSIGEICNQSTNLNGIKVDWGYDDNVATAYAKFEYAEYKYYLSVEDVSNPEYILELAKVLLS